MKTSKKEKMMNPPKPAAAHPMAVPVYLMRLTLIPTESAAPGFSPQARRRRPNLVLFIMSHKTRMAMTPKTTAELTPEKAVSTKVFPVLKRRYFIRLN